MRTQVECVPCFVNQAIRALRANGKDEDYIKRVLPEILDILRGIDFRSTPMENASILYEFIRNSLGVRDIYKEVKRTHNELLLRNYHKFKGFVEKCNDKLKAAIMLSCGANLVDLGSRDVSTDDIYDEIVVNSKKEFCVDHYYNLVEDLSNAQRVTFFLDNAGEAILDMLLVETILEVFSNISEIIVVAKAEPFINDITVEEAKEVGFEKLPRTRLMGVYPSKDRVPNYWSEEIRDLISSSDVVIAKGQANYEALDVEGIYHLFYVKCNAVSRYVGVPVGCPVLFKRRL